MATTVDVLPAGFWDDEDGPPLPALADRGDASAAVAPSARLEPAQTRPRPAPPQGTATGGPAPAAAPAGGPPALAALQGLALLQAVFPGRVVKIERATTADDAAAPDEPPVVDPDEAAEDDPDPGADAPRPRTP